MIVCPQCHKFLGKVKYWIDGNDDITKVIGDCKKHGTVEPNSWDYDDLIPEESQ